MCPELIEDEVFCNLIPQFGPPLSLLGEHVPSDCRVVLIICLPLCKEAEDYSVGRKGEEAGGGRGEEMWEERGRRGEERIRGVLWAPLLSHESTGRGCRAPPGQGGIGEERGRRGEERRREGGLTFSTPLSDFLGLVGGVSVSSHVSGSQQVTSSIIQSTDQSIFNQPLINHTINYSVNLSTRLSTDQSITIAIKSINRSVNKQGLAVQSSIS